ncbi:MAG: DNA-binding protein WhiA [Bacillota bacterium]|nr:DNA-binding protein WhiA [Bacillota bacterium]
MTDSGETAAEKLSFSAGVKEELLDRLPAVAAMPRSLQELELSLSLLAVAHIDAIDIQLTTARERYARRLQELLTALAGQPADLGSGREIVTLRIGAQPALDAVCALLERMAGADVIADRDGGGDAALPLMHAGENPDLRRHLLAVAFLASGSIAAPERAYHIEFALRRRRVAALIRQWLAAEGLEVQTHSRLGLVLLYLKEGQGLADLLALIGAHRAMLQFEALRVEKEMRNIVNRAVNCDSANARRIADSAARQLEALTWFQDQPGWAELPAELLEVACLRLAAPAASLRELGEMASPPLGKSGINHRLRRLEAIIAAARENNDSESAGGD